MWVMMPVLYLWLSVQKGTSAIIITYYNHDHENNHGDKEGEEEEDDIMSC